MLYQALQILAILLGPIWTGPGACANLAIQTNPSSLDLNAVHQVASHYCRPMLMSISGSLAQRTILPSPYITPRCLIDTKQWCTQCTEQFDASVLMIYAMHADRKGIISSWQPICYWYWSKQSCFMPKNEKRRRVAGFPLKLLVCSSLLYSFPMWQQAAWWGSLVGQKLIVLDKDAQVWQAICGMTWMDLSLDCQVRCLQA